MVSGRGAWCGKFEVVGKCKTPEDYHGLARSRGFDWLGPYTGRVLKNTTWRCGAGHEWEAPYATLQQGHGCPRCARVVPMSDEDYRSLAQAAGIAWSGPAVATTKTPTGWRCDEGHSWRASFNSVHNGSRCPTCWEARRGHDRRHGAEQYQQQALASGVTWVGPLPESAVDKTTWRCPARHEWRASYNSLASMGSGCPVCSGNARKVPEDYARAAADIGMELLGEAPASGALPARWRCRCGHEWHAPLSRLLRGHGCPQCAGNLRKTDNDYSELAKRSGLTWLGPSVHSTVTKTVWRCGASHTWEARYNDIQSGYGCPACVDMVNGARVSAQQRELAQMLSGVINAPLGRFCIDVAIERDGVPIAIEYDAWYWHGERDEQDEKRDRRLMRNGWRVLHIRSNAMLPTEEQLEDAIARLVAGEQWLEIVLEDWGVGPTRG